MLCTGYSIVSVTSAQIIIVFALFSSFSRAGLNVLDRYLIGLQHFPIIALSFLNNVGPALVMTLFTLALVDHPTGILAVFWNWKIAVIGALIQLTAYAFSYAFRSLTVNQVTCATKLSDIIIPFGILLSTGRWSAGAYTFALLTTAICFPLVWGESYRVDRPKKIVACGIICSVLFIQATWVPSLTGMSSSDLKASDALLMVTSIICWRTLWSMLPLLRGRRARPLRLYRKSSNDSVSFAMLMTLRSILTVVTQAAFIICVSSPSANIAWPILNSSGFFAMWLSRWFLRDTLNRREVTAIASITVLSIGRFFWT